MDICLGFSSKLQEIALFSLKIVNFCHFEYFNLHLSGSKFCPGVGEGGGGNFQFSVGFHEVNGVFKVFSVHSDRGFNLNEV